MKNVYIVKKCNYYDVPEEIAKKYIASLQNHIRYVREAGAKLKVPQAQLDIHDDSKWAVAEFPGYAMHFQGGGSPNEFAKALLHHIHFNNHHWQHYIFPDGYTPKDSVVENGIVEMPYSYVLEMVADWMGASKAYTDSWDMSDWLIENIPRIKVHSNTARLLRGILDGLGYADIVWMYNFASEGNKE